MKAACRIPVRIKAQPGRRKGTLSLSIHIDLNIAGISAGMNCAPKPRLPAEEALMQYFDSCYAPAPDDGTTRLFMHEVQRHYGSWCGLHQVKNKANASMLGRYLQKWIRLKHPNWTAQQHKRIKRRTARYSLGDFKRPEFYIGARLLPVEGMRKTRMS